MVNADAINRFLGKDETVLSTYLAGKGIYCATEKRVISYRKKLTGEKFSDVSYAHITTVNLESKIRKGLVYLGILVIFLGILSSISSTSLAAILFIIGLLIVIVGIVFKVSMYSVHTSGAEQLHFPSKKQNADNFVRIIRERMK